MSKKDFGLFDLLKKTLDEKYPKKDDSFTKQNYLSMLLGLFAYAYFLDYFRFFSHNWSWNSIGIYIFAFVPFVLGYIITSYSINSTFDFILKIYRSGIKKFLTKYF